MKIFKKITQLSALLLLGFVFIYSPVFAQNDENNTEIGTGITDAYENIESIRNYDTSIDVSPDGTMSVVENIEYDFGNLEKHGIYRNIPYAYKARGGNFKLRFSDFKVTDPNGVDYNFDKYTEGSEIVLKIGDPDKTITGRHVYVISYKVKRAINFFANDHDELYWNIIGTGWQVPILKAQSTVNMPANITKSVCYTGIVGSTASNCSILPQSDNQVIVRSSSVLNASEGLTMVIAIPFGSIAQPTTAEKIKDIVYDNGILALPLVIFIIMFLIWRKIGRDAKGRGVIVAQYEAPEGLSPMQVGAYLTGRVSNIHLSAEIINLAANGYIKINRLEKKSFFWSQPDYEFIKIKKPTKIYHNSVKLFESLFQTGDSVKLSDLKDDKLFIADIEKVKDALTEEMDKAKIYKYNPFNVRFLIIFVAFFLFVFGLILLGSLFGAYGVLSVFISFIIALIFGIIMPARTKLGAEIQELILGFKKYLSVAEADRINFHNAPEKTPERFEALLPFAMALGVEKQWAKQFEDIYKQNPSWYSDGSGNMFSATAFASSLTEVSSNFQSTMTTSSDGGSGFSGGGSGGGGGGGGGGSW